MISFPSGRYFVCYLTNMSLGFGKCCLVDIFQFGDAGKREMKDATASGKVREKKF